MRFRSNQTCLYRIHRKINPILQKCADCLCVCPFFSPSFLPSFAIILPFIERENTCSHDAASCGRSNQSYGWMDGRTEGGIVSLQLRTYISPAQRGASAVRVKSLIIATTITSELAARSSAAGRERVGTRTEWKGEGIEGGREGRGKSTLRRINCLGSSNVRQIICAAVWGLIELNEKNTRWYL